jgi:NAD(P)-dependent dehydrogenase (short-subunit alcohol dehydrogenase family)
MFQLSDFLENGANVILADWNEEQLNNLVIELKSATEPGNGRLTSRKTNVADWNDLVEVFEQGFNEFGAIDAVISNAGVNWGETLLQHEVDPVTKKLKPPSLEALNINLVGHIYAVNCATYYFEKQQRRPTQIVITASAAAFIDTPPLYLYSAAKAGLLGMMRSLRNDLPRRGTTINLVAPWMTSK